MLRASRLVLFCLCEGAARCRTSFKEKDMQKIWFARNVGTRVVLEQTEVITPEHWETEPTEVIQQKVEFLMAEFDIDEVTANHVLFRML